jgi:hypothetical protein
VRRDAAALPLGGDAGRGVRGPHPGLGRRRGGGGGGGFQLFQGAELVDPFSIRDIPFEPGKLVDPAGDNGGIYCRTRFGVAGRRRLGIRR